MTADRERLLALLGEIEATDPQLAHQIKELADGYEYDRLAELFA